MKFHKDTDIEKILFYFLIPFVFFLGLVLRFYIWLRGGRIGGKDARRKN